MSIDQWREDLATAALVGTARRPVPESPPVLPRPTQGAPPETALLDAVAVAAALRRAGTAPRHGEEAATPAPDDEHAPPPDRARQLLDLLLTQPPVGARLAPYSLLVWLRTARATGRRAHHQALVPLLERASTTALLRPAVVPVLDHRGTWLAAQNPAWAWAAAGGDPAERADDGDWELLPTLDRAVRLRRVRARDPEGGRALLESTWRQDAAVVRSELLACLEVGLSPADEPLLERALDDRAQGVRETAYRLLDRLPESRRARRLGDVLAPLLSTSGLVRTIHVELPTRPTKEAVRDGLTAAPRGRSERGFWLQRLAAGAPFETWTRATGLDAATIVGTLGDADALAGLQGSAVGRRDATWARALLDRVWDPGLARCLPAEEVAQHMLARIERVQDVPELVSALRLAPGPWPERTSARIVTRLARLDRHPHHLPDLVATLAEGLHPATAGAVQRLAATGAGPTDPFHQLAQHLSLVPTITEAFA